MSFLSDDDIKASLGGGPCRKLGAGESEGGERDTAREGERGTGREPGGNRGSRLSNRGSKSSIMRTYMFRPASKQGIALILFTWTFRRRDHTTKRMRRGRDFKCVHMCVAMHAHFDARTCS